MPDPVGFSRGGFSSGGGGGAAAGGGLQFISPIVMSPNNLEFSIGYELISSEGQLIPGWTAAAWGTGGLGVFYPFWVPNAVTVTQLWTSNGAVVAGNSNVGIFDSSFAKVIDTGATLMAGAGAIQFFDVADTALTAGSTYYMGLSHSEATATFGRASQSALRFAAMGCFQQASVDTFPNPLTPATITTTNLPFFGFTSGASF